MLCIAKEAIEEFMDKLIYIRHQLAHFVCSEAGTEFVIGFTVI